MNFGILVFPDVEELDFVGPWEMLGMWSKFAGGTEHCLIVAQSLGPVICAKGLSVNPHVSFQQCPQLDFLLVPGGMGTRKEVDNVVLINFITEQTKLCKAVLSVCTGSFLLHRAGLLSGKKATTHWNSLDRLRELGDVTVVEERFVLDGNVWTSAGVSAGTDLILAFIADFAGEETAGKIQLAAEYYPSAKRYGAAHKSPMAPRYLKKTGKLRMQKASDIVIRDAEKKDYASVMALYKQLNPDDPAVDEPKAKPVFENIIESGSNFLLVAEINNDVVSSCYLNIIPNLTRNARPYAVIENVITDRNYRNRGVGKAIMQYAINQAWEAGCYKVMLMTGRKEESTMNLPAASCRVSEV